MGELVDALVRVLEFMVQGALAVLLGGYLLAWLHAIKKWVYEHASQITSYMLGANWRDRLHQHTRVAIGLGALYFLGVTTNAVSYWLLEPIHDEVIFRVESRQLLPRPIALADVLDSAAHRRFNTAGTTNRDDYPNYIKNEVDWRNLNLDAMKHALDPLLKQGRVIRGAVIISLGFLIVSILKAATFVVALLPLALQKTNDGFGKKVFDHIVEPSEVAKKDDPPIKRTFAYAAVNMVYAIVAFVVLWCSLGAYVTLEREYHYMAHYGPLSARDAIELRKDSAKGPQSSQTIP